MNAMTCQEARESIPWVPAGALEPEERVRVVRHTAQCADCRRELAAACVEHRLTRSAVASLTGLTPDAWARFEERLPVAPSGRTSRVASLRTLLERLGVPGLATEALGMAEKLRREGARVEALLPRVALEGFAS